MRHIRHRADVNGGEMLTYDAENVNDSLKGLKKHAERAKIRQNIKLQKCEVRHEWTVAVVVSNR